ncbi:MAG: phospholipase D-like domain-containing protein [Elusimicrobiales bacterium]|nr:phospholipase D-like domain-containing protein [Elusimicrobiales bacterium]
MLKRLYKPAAFFLAAFLLSPGKAAAGAYDALADYSAPAITIPLAPPPARAFLRGDFSGFPAYSFAYLNDLNTELIDASVRSVDAVMFSITLRDNPDALIRAKNRGARVRLIVDEQHVYPRADTEILRLLAEPGLEVRTLRGTRAYGVNHNKILICDNAAAAVGSYNWTFGATFSNLENTLVARAPVYTDGYARYFDWMWARARTAAQGPSPELPEGFYGAPPQDQSPLYSFNGTPVPAYLFSPGSRSEERLAAILDAAASSADIVTFTFSSRVLADAVARAQARGVRVRFLMDQNMAKTSPLAKYLFDSGVPFRWRLGRTDTGALHDKFAILDGRLLETGSFNWTANASRNSFENIIFVTEPAVVRGYQETFDRLFDTAAAPADFPDIPAD